MKMCLSMAAALWAIRMVVVVYGIVVLIMVLIMVVPGNCVLQRLA